MTAEELLKLNGDAQGSPLLDTLGRIHDVFSSRGIAYAAVGGIAVIAHGGHRTTHDIDILTTRKGWEELRRDRPERFECRMDSAVDRANGVPIDVLFSGDAWDMVIPLPDPAGCSVFLADLGANVMDLLHILELKTAVYMARSRTEGRELASKDLADVVSLIQANRSRITRDLLEAMHPRVRRRVRRIAARVGRPQRKRG